MCGITGVLRWEGGPPLDGEIRAMTQAVAHRGPDGDGVWVGERVAIGHRRLSIIDPAGGAQPMWDEAQRVGLTFNGEIYNYRALRDTLIEKGHRFGTRSDSEVLLHAYLEWGERCVERLRGMFAFCVVDLDKKRLFLARDHFGIKPLVYRHGKGFFAFASEINALCPVGGPPTGSLAALDLFLRYQYIPAPDTIFHEIRKLPPAHTLVVDFDGRMTGPTRYWDFRFEPEEGASLELWVERFEAVLEASVKAHLVADVPFGVFLSGGIDSSLVAGAMRRILGPGVLGFTIGFDEARISELEYARTVAKEWEFELVSDTVRASLLDELPRMVAQVGEPFGDASLVPTFEVARLARGRVPMVLSGDGGDEAFAGYDTHLAWLTGHPLRPYVSRLKARPSVSRALSLLGAAAKRGLGHDLHAVEDWERFILYLGEEGRRRLWRPELLAVASSPSATFARAARAAREMDHLAFAQYMDFQTYLPSDILTKVDSASMAVGLEVRTPLIDLEVLEVARKIPAALRVERRGGRLVGKQIPKRALRRWFPASFVDRNKQGFGIPRQAWFQPRGKGRQMLERLLERPEIFEFFEEREIRSLLLEQDRGVSRDGALWLLLVFGLWREQRPTVVFS